MTRTLTFAAALLICAAVACGDDDEDHNATRNNQTTTPTSMRPPAANDDMGTTTPMPSSQVRVAHLSPDAPAVDFCFVPPQGEPIGPILTEAGFAQGVAFGEVTPYLPSSDGLFGIRILGGGASSCDNPVVEFPNIAVPGGGLQITAAAVGLFAEGAEPGLNLVFFIDDNSAPPAGKTKVRVVHAAPGLPNVHVGALADGAATLDTDNLLVSNLGYALMTSPPYVELDAISSLTLRVETVDDPTMGADFAGLELVEGVTTTVFAIGESLGELQLLICDDIMGDCVLGP